MKQLCKRGLAMLMVLVMLVMLLGLLPAITFQTQAASYTYNWGTRGELATELSDAAIAWYEKYNITYDELSALSGSSSTGSVPSSALYTELKSLMTTAHSTKTSYDGTKSMYAYTDCQNGGGKISSFYSGTAIGPSWDGNWNREHTWPKSKSLNGSSDGGQDETDIMMLRPTTTSENSSRGNTAYGESSGYYDPNEESGGTYNLRGDCARIVLYVYVRWGNTSYMWGSSGVMESKDVLLKWMEEDPVDTWELGRNDAVQSITGTRNVFVDYPELAFDLFEEEVPAGYDTPSGSIPAYSITATSNNTAYGTVALSGRTITATPKTGYYASGYTVTGGSATVTQNGNVFTVIAASDCTVQINFAPKTAVTVSFSGATVAAQSGYAGDSMALPTAEAPEGYKFLGWMTSSLSSDTTEKPSYYTDSFVPAANTTLYALYSYVDENSTGGGTGDYVKVTEAPADWSGEYVIVNEAESVIMDGSLSSFDANGNIQSVTISGNTIAAASGDPYKFTIAAYSTGYSIQGTSGMYFGAASAQNSLTTSSSALVNTISLNSDGSAAIRGTGGYVLRYNSGSSRFRYYNGTQEAIALYVKDGTNGTTYYTGNPVQCEHTNTSDVAAVAATCTESGYTAGVQCDDCGNIISGHQVVDALGHSWSDWTETTAPGCEAAGEETRTCATCGETETQTVAATGHSYGAWTETTAPTCTADGEQSHTCSACGKIETQAVAATGHSYVADGLVYTCSVCGDSYEVEESTTLQYVFSDYETGTQYAQGEDHTLDETVTLTINGAHLNGSIRLYNGSNAVFTSTKVIDSVVIKAGNKAATLNVYGSTDGETWTLIQALTTTSAYAEHSVDMPAESSYKYLKLESVGAQIRVSEMTIVVLAVDNTPPACTHENVITDAAVDASCTETGLTEGSHCADCGDVITAQEEVAALGHNYVLSGNTYTCDRCGDSYDVWFVNFSVPDGVAAIEKIEYTEGGITLPEAGVPTGDYSYTFAGWAAEEVDNSESAPTLYKAGQTYTAEAETTLYAVYTYKVEGTGSGSGNYVKVTEAPEDWSGEYVIVYETLSYIFDGSLEKLDAVSNYKEVTITDHTITAEEGDPCKFIIAAVDGGYSVQAANGSYIGRAATSNGLNESSTPYVHTITINSFSNVEITSSYGPYLNFNAGDTQLRFRYYATGQKPIQLYVKDGSAVSVYYTTVIGTECQHTNTTTTTVEASCTAAGSVTVTCDDCGETVSTDEIAALGHSYESVVTPPTATEQGYTTHTCSVCGDSYVDSYTDPVVPETPTVNLRFAGASLVLKSDLTMNFKVNERVQNQYENIWVEFEMNGVKTVFEEGTISGTDLIFAFQGIAPRMIKDNIAATMHGTFDGVEYVYTLNYSAYKNLNNLLSSGDSVLQTLVVDLLNYGTAHQIYMDYNTDTLINADLTDEQKAWGTTADPTLENITSGKYVTHAAPTASFKAPALKLSNAVEMVFTLNCANLTDMTGVALKIEVEDDIDGTITYTVDASDFEYDATANTYKVYFKNLLARQLRCPVYATIMQNGEAISHTMRYSVESYAYSAQNNTTVPGLADLVKAMMRYGDATYAYVNG